MKPEAQRIAIAEACGWERREPDNLYPEVRWLDPSNKTIWRSDYAVKSTGLPDYLSDLNAMHEAEKVLTFEQLKKYVQELCMQVEDDENYCPHLATAPQRAEAFLRTLNLWND